MFDKKRVGEIAVKGKVEKWEYPRIFNALKDAGVEYYETSVSTHHIVYHGNGDSVEERPPADFKKLLISDKFNATGVKDAVKRTQNKETDYGQFLQEIASSGVIKYKVDMDERTVTYIGSNDDERYIESVPNF